MLNVKNLSKKFEDVTILDDISLEIDAGNIIGLAGPSGGGKSTLLRLIQKFELPTSGVIECKGRTGFMFQDFQLFPHMTVLENVLYAPTLNKKNLNLKSRLIRLLESYARSYKIKGYPENLILRAMQLLENLAIAHKAHDYPENLSGGQKQRVALARSLMMDPEVLLCDEPTSGLDVATTLDVVNLLESVRALGVTMIIASHDLDFLTKISDRIILLKAGKIAVDIRTHLIDNPIEYLKVYY